MPCFGAAVAERMSQNNYKRYEGTGVATSGYAEVISLKQNIR